LLGIVDEAGGAGVVGVVDDRGHVGVSANVGMCDGTGARKASTKVSLPDSERTRPRGSCAIATTIRFDGSLIDSSFMEKPFITTKRSSASNGAAASDRDGLTRQGGAPIVR
jgi:hypothetical protein